MKPKRKSSSSPRPIRDNSGNDTDAKRTSTKRLKTGDHDTPSTTPATSSSTTTLDPFGVVKNNYRGWTVPSPNYTIPILEINDSTSAETLFRDYVATRRPVVLRGRLADVVTPFYKWTNDYLRTIVGDQTVQVEQRASDKDSFGKGNEVPMTISHFLDLMEQGDSKFYLTTQDVQADGDDNDDVDDDDGHGRGRPDLMAPFMNVLKDDFPLVPIIMGSLVPQNINLWMGNSVNGSSSGLHHDYHDNLYIVIRGTKRFHLFSPMDASSMKTRGSLSMVHANGRINYHGEPTTAYGADLQSDAAARATKAKEMAEERLIKAEQAVEDGIEGAEKELEAAEEQLEAAMEALLDIEMEGDANESGEDDDNDDDDDVDDEEEEGEVNDDDDDEKGLGGQSSSSTRAKSSRAKSSHLDQPPRVKGRRLVDKTVKDPDNFSTMVINLDCQGAERFPETTANVACCTVHEGDILYLPASWFHEVVSIGRPPSPSLQNKSVQQGVGGGGGHLALNYWFHPPDALDNFEKPYSTDFWPNDFQQRLDDMKKKKSKQGI